uniref:NADH-ubiquinone oxidoreductase chain 3 n=1 Tax=Mergus squamatus TaxID=670348 RepID=H6TBM3_9AVES|nr:NADH dehydrogenase subunit 3 [Mergus squamatus]ADX36091.1 NADH dehydrogenase subunit 3 [Mergus squamatus]
MNMLTFMLSLSLILSATLTALNFWLAQMSPDSEKLSPYECGFDPLGSARLPFSIRFFLSSHPIPPFRPTNCPSTPPAMGHPTTITPTDPHLGCNYSTPPDTRTGLRMIP